MEYQWYPGHMTRARRMMEENVRLVDLVIEILDARVPMSSRNPDIDRIAGGKSRLILLAKADLADPAQTERFARILEEDGRTVLAVDARSGKANTEIRRAIRTATKEKRERDRRRGLVNRPVRAMVCGIPNVGKSTFINTLSGRKSAKTGNTPGVTRGKQWISLGEIDLLDTPGILWPKFEDRQVGLHLAMIGSIRDEILDEEELAQELLAILLRRYPDLLRARYGVSTEEVPEPGGGAAAAMSSSGGSLLTARPERAVKGSGDDISSSVKCDKDDVQPEEMAYNLYELLRRIALSRGLVRSGAEADTKRAAHLLLDEFRSGRIGRITLDEVEACGAKADRF